jgi:hypothetical protein
MILKLLVFIICWRQLATHLIPIYFFFSYRVQRSLILHFSNNCLLIKLFRFLLFNLIVLAGTVFFFTENGKASSPLRRFFSLYFAVLKSSTIRLSSTSMKLGVFKPMLSPF